MAQRPWHRHPAGTSLPRVAGLAVVVVAAVVLARARAAGIAPPPVDGSAREVVRSVLQVLAVTVLAAGLVLLLGYRRPSAAPVAVADRKPKAAAADRRRVLVALFVGLLLALVLHVLGGLVNDPAARRAPPTPPAPTEVPQSDRVWGEPGARDEGSGLGDTLVLTAILVALGALGVALLRQGDVLEPAADGEDGEDGEDAAVARAVRAGRVAVREAAELDPRAAIVACFAAMEDALADRGEDIGPRVADTPEEVLTRGVACASLPEQPATVLLTVFREARFSTHPITEQDRADADRALAALLAALGTQTGTRRPGGDR